VFVEIQFDTSHLVAMLAKHFPPDCKMSLMGTIQFTNALHRAQQELLSTFANLRIPQGKPLSPGKECALYVALHICSFFDCTFIIHIHTPGETLGCTSTILPESDALVFVADGRFHLEAAMIQNPTVPAYRYDPYSKILSSEGYDTERLKAVRW